VNCGAFERWLDDGGPGALSTAARAHAAACPHCGRALRAARTIEVLLAAPPTAEARGDFTGRVMARVDGARRDAFAAWTPLAPAAGLPPLWMRLLAEPSVLLALALAAVVALATGPGLAALGAALQQERAMPALAPGPAGYVPWLVAAWLLALAAAPLVRWAERLTSASVAR
jgi:hypothetical protein